MTGDAETGPSGAGGAALRVPLGGAGAPLALMSRKADGSMRHEAGVSNPVREAWFESLGFARSRVVMPYLDHTRRVVAARTQAELEGFMCDGVVTDDREAALAITVADCMPIFLYDEGSGAFGILHSGWRGTGILASALELMAERFGTRPRDVSATFGPRIGPCCYVVDEERAAAFAAEFGEGSVARVGGKPRLDLAAANRGLAERLGLGSLHVMEGCTSCDERLGSFRREGPAAFTRMAAVIGYR